MLFMSFPFTVFLLKTCLSWFRCILKKENSVPILTKRMQIASNSEPFFKSWGVFILFHFSGILLLTHQELCHLERQKEYWIIQQIEEHTPSYSMMAFAVFFLIEIS